MSKVREVDNVDAWSKEASLLLETNHLDGVRQVVEAAMTAPKASPLEKKALELFGKHVDVFASRDWAGERAVYDEINENSPANVLAFKETLAPIRHDYEASFCAASTALKSAEPDSLLGRFATCVRDNYAYGLFARVHHFTQNKPAAAPK